MEKEGFKCERVGEIGHLVLKKSVIFNSGSQAGQSLAWNWFSLCPMPRTPSHSGKKNCQPGRKPTGKGTDEYELLSFSKRSRVTPAQAALQSPHRSSPNYDPPHRVHRQLGLMKLQMPAFKYPLILHTIPRDLVAQVWVTPES